MATNQPVTHLNVLPVVETLMIGTAPIVVANPRGDADGQTAKWNSFIDRIAGWAPAAGEPDVRTDEEGYRLPGRKTVALAMEIAARLLEGGVCPPDWVVQDGDGGIHFEWCGGGRAETLNINARGDTELMEFEHSKLIARKLVSFVPAER